MASGIALAGERDRVGPARGHEALEAVLVGHVEEEPREVLVVVDDEEHAVARLDRLAVVRDLEGRRRRTGSLSRAASRSERSETTLVGGGRRLRPGRAASAARRTAAGRA